MLKDWFDYLFDYLVGTAQIITAWGVLAAFKQAKVTQKQLEVTQAQLEEAQKNGKPEVHIVANNKDDGLSIIAINVKNVPIFVKSYTVLLKHTNHPFKTKVLSTEERFGFRSKGLGVLNIGEHCEVWIPAPFFFELYRGIFRPTDEDELERVDIVFNIPGISPDPQISLAINRHTMIFHGKDDLQNVTLIIDQLTNNGRETIAQWHLKIEDEIDRIW